jgi:T-complex protein 1 subunit alpha
MLLDGDRTSGQDVRTQNVTAAMAIANIVKSSLGPVGLDKMLVDEVHSLTHSLTHLFEYFLTHSSI